MDTEPRILEFQLLAANNPERLISNVNCEIIGDSVIEGWIPHITSDKHLIPHFTSVGSVSIENNRVVSDTTVVDFTQPVVLKVEEEQNTRVYRVLIHAFTGLPTCWIQTNDGKDIYSKYDFKKGHIKIQEDVVTRSAGDVFEADMQIRGRGNSTWDLPKKPYKVMFENKESILGMPSGKSWSFLANYADKSMIRNRVATYLGNLSRLSWTPRSRFAEVFLNGRYQGTYQITEKVSISKHRVDISEDGFLLEIDAYAPGDVTARYFYTNRLSQPINIKEPVVKMYDEKFNQAKSAIFEAEKALYGNDFKDEEKGWRKYFDAESMVDWYIINEISKNWDAIRWSSTYMTWTPGGKIIMGPLWDFDIAFGNSENGGDGCDSRPQGFHIKNLAWISRLFEDPYFVQLVKERWPYFYSKKSAIMAEINEDANYLKLSVLENDNKWQILYNHTWRNRDIWGSYMNEIENLKEWLDVRMDWLDKEFSRM
ncbi:MAG: CotH kinase family protein [Prevotella sp.]|nr:CotH kinase family protein [Prevotella sp.]